MFIMIKKTTDVIMIDFTLSVPIRYISLSIDDSCDFEELDDENPESESCLFASIFDAKKVGKVSKFKLYQ